MQALQGSNALVIATEWKVDRNPDFVAIKAALLEAGLKYEGIGRRARKESHVVF